MGLNHSNIIKMRDEFERDGTPVIVLEYADGGSLINHLLPERGSVCKLSEQQIKNFTKDILLALAYLHGKGIIHKDIKPDNILVMADSRAVLSDFGLAERMTKGTDCRYYFSGTLPYLAPEVIYMTPYDGRVDIWSLGITIYATATGKYPYAPSDKFTVDNLKEEMELGMPILSEELEHMSPDFASFISGCLPIDPHKRMTAIDALSHRWMQSV